MTKKKILIIIVSFAIFAGLFFFAQRIQTNYLAKSNKETVEKVSGTAANKKGGAISDESSNSGVDKTHDGTGTTEGAAHQGKTDASHSTAVTNKSGNDTGSKVTSTDADTKKTDTTNTVKTTAPQPAADEAKHAAEPAPAVTRPSAEADMTIINGITGKVLLNKYVKYESQTVADITIKMLDASNISYKTSGIGSTIYFSSIGGLNEKAEGPLSGWVYYVKKSGTSSFIKPSVGAGGFILHEGDSLMWKYLKNALN